jgi:hypothetical protein
MLRLWSTRHRVEDELSNVAIASLMALSKIVSGGQTGVDRGALDAALVAGFACGGYRWPVR